MTSSIVIGALDSARQAAIRAEARFTALRVLKATFKAWSAETKKSQKDLAEILNSDPAHISRVLAGDKRSMTIETLFLLARAMGRRPRISMDPIETLSAKKPNYDARPNFIRIEKSVFLDNTLVGSTASVEAKSVSKTTSSETITSLRFVEIFQNETTVASE